MPLNVVIPSNLDTDFTIDVAKSKIYNNSIIIGAGVPVANPPVEEKVWLYARNDNGGVAGDYAITHIWEPATLVWEPLGAAVDFRLSAVSVDANTGEVTFTVTDPVSGASSTITTDLTNLVDVQETVTVLTEVTPGQLNYTDEDAVVNVVDISGLRDTGQTAQRVEVIGDTFNLIPNGTDTRVVVDNASSTATFADGTTTSIHYTGDNVLGMGSPGDAGVVIGSGTIGMSYVIEPAAGIIQGGIIASDSGFAQSSSLDVTRDSTNDTSLSSLLNSTDAGYMANSLLNASPTVAVGLTQISAPSSVNSVTQMLIADATTSSIALTSSAGTDSRNITIEPTAIKIGAGDVASNSVGGADGDVLVRFGTGSEVRYASIGSVVGAELNVNTATPELEVVVGGSVVDTVGLLDVLDAFNVHQFYAIP